MTGIVTKYKRIRAAAGASEDRAPSSAPPASSSCGRDGRWTIRNRVRFATFLAIMQRDVRAAVPIMLGVMPKLLPTLTRLRRVPGLVAQRLQQSWYRRSRL